jgi:DNA-binding MarR family transcriptional regulator
MEPEKRRDQIGQLAEAILQTVPPLYRRLVRTNETAECYMLGYPKISILIVLKKNGTMSLSAIAQNLSYSKQNLTTLTDQLEAAGYVKRVQDSEDRRVTNLEITPAGLAHLNEGRERMRKALIEDLDHLSDEDIETLHDSFEKVLVIFIKTSEARRNAKARTQ